MIPNIYAGKILDSLQEELVSEDLKEEIEDFSDYSNLLAPQREIEIIARHFADWQKQQMMKDAVEGYVDQLEFPGETFIGLSVNPEGLKNGEEVKVIIIKQEEE